MIFDRVESQGFQVEQLDVKNRLMSLKNELGTLKKSVDGCYQSVDSVVDRRLAKFLGIEDAGVIASFHPTIMEATGEMLHGAEHNGCRSMGLSDLSKWKLDKNSKFYNTNLNQQAGYAAEILSAYKENLAAHIKGSDLKTYRADDLPEIFKKNDQYVDKVRMDSNGNIVARIQTKFIGDNGREWLSKMMSSKYEKYLNDGKVDKLECPKDFYSDVKAAIPERVGRLEKQLERVKAEGKTDVIENIQKKIDKLNKINEMLEQSNTTKGEAKFARLHPKMAAAKVFMPEMAKLSHTEGVKGGASAASLTFTVSAVDHISSCVNGEITVGEMVKDISKETAAAGALGYGTAFISTAVSQASTASSSQLITSVGESCLPAAMISFAVESYDSISQFAQGKIDGAELAYDLGESASGIAGGIAGGAIAGSIAGPGGTVVGGIVGGVVGCAVASEIYATAVEAGAEHLDKFAGKAQKFADSTVEAIAKNAPEKLDSARAAINDYASKIRIPIYV